MDQARAAFDTLLTRYPNDPNIHYAFGVYMLPQDADVAMKSDKSADTATHIRASMR